MKIPRIIYRVVKLVIKKPAYLNHRPGDYVFVNIPAIANSEWHPFTISSAPEDKSCLTLHIRVLGNWTNKLYQYFEAMKLAEIKWRKLKILAK